MSEPRNSNKLLFWFVSNRPRRMKINCCFVFSQNADSDSIQESQPDGGPSTTPRRPSTSKKSSKRPATAPRRRVITRDQIGLPTNFVHLTHLGPDSPGVLDLNNVNQLAIVCGSSSSF